MKTGTAIQWSVKITGQRRLARNSLLDIASPSGGASC
jgi:hypothetical protein